MSQRSTRCTTQRSNSAWQRTLTIWCGTGRSGLLLLLSLSVDQRQEVLRGCTLRACLHESEVLFAVPPFMKMLLQLYTGWCPLFTINSLTVFTRCFVVKLLAHTEKRRHSSVASVEIIFIPPFAIVVNRNFKALPSTVR